MLVGKLMMMMMMMKLQCVMKSSKKVPSNDLGKFFFFFLPVHSLIYYFALTHKQSYSYKFRVIKEQLNWTETAIIEGRTGEDYFTIYRTLDEVGFM